MKKFINSKKNSSISAKDFFDSEVTKKSSLNIKGGKRTVKEIIKPDGSAEYIIIEN